MRYICKACGAEFILTLLKPAPDTEDIQPACCPFCDSAGRYLEVMKI